MPTAVLAKPHNMGTMSPISVSNAVKAGMSRTITWSNTTWLVRSGSGDPDRNLWSNSANSVWIDKFGHMHLTVQKVGRSWYSTEVDSATQIYTYGNYSWFIETPIMNLDPNIVSAMFYYYNDSCELDIEASQWGNPTFSHLTYTVQPSDYVDLIPYKSPYASMGNITWAFDWEPTYVNFTATLQNGTIIATYNNTNVKIIPHVKSGIDMNMWLTNHWAPRNGKNAEMVIDWFKYTPSK